MEEPKEKCWRDKDIGIVKTSYKPRKSFSAMDNASLSWAFLKLWTPEDEMKTNAQVWDTQMGFRA